MPKLSMQPKTAGITLEELFQKFIAFKQIKNLSPESIIYYEKCYRFFTEHYPAAQPCAGITTRKHVFRPYHLTETEIQRKNNDTARYIEIMKKRQIWCEGNNSHQKARHCLERAKMRGIDNVREQCLMSACALNLKRLVKWLKKTGKDAVKDAVLSVFSLVIFRRL